MRTSLAVIFVGVLTLASQAAFAGNLSFSNGKSEWTPTGCVEPVAPVSLEAMDSETSASDMNKLSDTYNLYADKMQSYMNCLSSEAEADSSAVSAAIMRSAQDRIAVAQRKVGNIHDALQSKQQD